MDSDRTYEVAIAGAGAAGLSAALVLGRARRRVALCDDGTPRNGVADEMHGFVGLDGTSPSEFLARARADVARYPSVDATLGGIRSAVAHPDGFALELASGAAIVARRLLIATGMADELPPIDGIGALWGRGVFVCPYCEGWEVRDRPLAVYAADGDPIGLAQELYQWSTHLRVFIRDEDRLPADARAWLRATGTTLVRERLQAVEGHGRLEKLVLENGERIDCDALFLCARLRQRSDLAARLGCELTDADAIVIDAQNRTNVPGCYAAGDAVTHFHQVVLAAASGARAAICLNGDLTEQSTAATVAAVLENR